MSNLKRTSTSGSTKKTNRNLYLYQCTSNSSTNGMINTGNYIRTQYSLISRDTGKIYQCDQNTCSSAWQKTVPITRNIRNKQ